MSLSLSLGSATSSLRAIQTQLALASSNIANADTDGYTIKSASKVSTVTGGLGTGTEIAAIISKVDSNLLKSIAAAASDDSAAATTADYLDRLGDALGELSSDDSGSDSLSASLADLVSALEELAATPESDTLKTQAVLGLVDAAAGLRDTSAQVQSLRADADTDIETAVATVNQSLNAIDALNASITEARARGESSADLEDQRMVLVQDLTEQIDISYFTGADGAMTIYAGGEALLNSQVHELSYQAAGTVTGETVYPGGFDAITLNGKDITSSLKSGKLAALVELRDETLPEVQEQLDDVASALKDGLNTLHNQGSAVPPPQTLTGTVGGLSSTDSFSGTGTLQVVIADQDGNTVTSADIDLSTLTSLDDLLTALNAVSGLSASLDADGQLVLEATDSTTGVALSGGGGGDSLSAYFGLNDLLTGDGAEDMFVRSDIAASPSLLAVGSVDDDGVTLNAGALSQAMADAVSASDVSDAASTIISDASAKLEQANRESASAETTLNALTESFSSQYGVNIDEETARISELENAYSASAQVLSTVQEMFDALLEAVR